ncbi:hypothetical protein [Cysteiniphilum sp. JM-1]|uniref:hypothetical protein n=1 Tax=Cysteiniphilum sp. JM-1 TaxID=2610891 RepID=UPI001247CA85|nr:hypothetical protein [Cysteiniphilum sp. JM-1]
MSKTENSKNRNQSLDDSVSKENNQKNLTDNKISDSNTQIKSDKNNILDDSDVYEQDGKPRSPLEKKVREILNEQNYGTAPEVGERLRRQLNFDINTFFRSKRLVSVPKELYNSPLFLNKFAYLISEALVNKNAKDQVLLIPTDQAKLTQVAKTLRVEAYKAQNGHDYLEHFDHTQEERHNYLVIDTRGQDTHKLALGKNKQFKLYRDDHHQGGFSLRFPQGKFHKEALAQAIMLEAGYQPYGTLKNLKNDALTAILDQLIEQGVDISGLKVEGNANQHAILKNKQIEQANFQEKVIKQINNEVIYKDQGVEKLTYPAYKLKSEAQRRLDGTHSPEAVIEKFVQALVQEMNHELPA